MERFPSSRIVYVSSGNVYPFTNTSGKGATEKDLTEPVGEYAQSRLGGERLVQFLAEKNKTPTAIIRLFYATELRYGIILDIAQKVMDNKPINLGMGYMNQIWQGDANACLARSFPLCEVPARVINLTGTDVLSVRKIANQLGGLLNRQPVFEGEEKPTALLGDASAATSIFGQPAISPEQITHWVADWVKRGGTTLGKPTKFEVRSGEF
jgi:nucleoside-diphosphate-sugar epimerase